MARFLSAKVEGFDQIIRKLEPTHLYSRQWETALRKVTRGVATLIRSRAPQGETRNLQASVATRYDPKPVPLWSVVASDWQAKNSFRYGWALDASKLVRYRYRSGPLAGRLTFGWFSRAVGKGSKTMKLMTEPLNEAVRSIEAKWRSP